MSTSAPAEAAQITSPVTFYPEKVEYALAKDAAGMEYYYQAIAQNVSPADALKQMPQKVAEGLNGIGGIHTMAGSTFSGTTILMNDKITFIGGVAAGSNTNGAPPGYVWSPDVTNYREYYDVIPTTAQFPIDPAEIDFINYGYTLERLKHCAHDEGLTPEIILPNPDGYMTTLVNAWCDGPAIYTIAIDTADIGTASRSPTLYDPAGPLFKWTTDLTAAFGADFPDSGFVRSQASQYDDTGSSGTSGGNLAVLDPELKLIKQVCSTGTGCIGPNGEDLGLDLSKPSHWIADTTPGDLEFGDGTYPTGVSLSSIGVTEGVERTLISSGSASDTVEWKMTALNEGNVSLYDITVSSDQINIEPGPSGKGLELKKTATGATDPNANTCANRVFESTVTSPLTPHDPLYNNDPAGYSLSILCKTQFNESLSGFDGTIQNTAALNASLPEGWLVYRTPPAQGSQVIPMKTTPVANVTVLPNGQTYVPSNFNWMPFIDPAGQYLKNRFSGYTADGRQTVQGFIPSNVDSAQLVIANPELKVTKWVCSTGTDCLIPASQEARNALAGYNERTHQMMASSATGGWVKSRNDVPYDGDVQWLVMVTNTGNDYLSNLTIIDEARINLAEEPITINTAPAVASGQQQILNQLAGSEGRLPPYQTLPLTYVMQHVTATGDVGGYSDTPPGPNDRLERVYVPGHDLVNEVTIEGTPVFANGEPIPDPTNNNEPMEAIRSNTSIAEVSTIPPDPRMKLTKWVCSTGTGCTAPNTLTADQLATMSGVPTTGAVTEGTALTTTGGWQRAGTVVPYDNVANWLVVASNIGDPPLMIEPSNIVDRVSGSGHGVTSALAYDTARVLLPRQSMLLTSSTVDISNVQDTATVKTTELDQYAKEYGYEIQPNSKIVNEVQITPTPTDRNGNKLPKQNTYVPLTGVPEETMTAPPTNWSYAEVNTIQPNAKLKATKWVCARENQNCDLDATTLDTLAGIERTGSEFTVREGSPAGGWEKQYASLDYGADAKWLVVAANIGATHLVQVSISDLAPSAPGHDATTVTGTNTIPNYIMPPGGVTYFQLTTPNVTNTKPLKPNATGATLVVDTQEVTDEQAQTDVGVTPGQDLGDPNDTPTVGVTNSTNQALLAIVNQARVSGTPAHSDGTILAEPGQDTDPSEVPRDPMEPIWSNLSTAEARTDVPEAAIDLAKWVCADGISCTPADELTRVQIAALSDPESPGAYGWVPATTVFPYGSDAQWLLVATNVGHVDLSDVKVEYEYVANDDTTDTPGADPTKPVGCEAGTLFDLSHEAHDGQLAPMQSVVMTCRTPYISNLNALGSDDEVVNTAQVQGTAVDDDGEFLPAPDGVDGYLEAHSERRQARVNTVLADPRLSLAKWVCQSEPCQVRTDDLEALADKDNATPPGGWVNEATVPYDSTVTWLIVVKNTGNEYMNNVRILNDPVGAPGLAGDYMTMGTSTTPLAGRIPPGCTEGAASAAFTPDDNLMIPGEIAYITCTTDNVTNTDVQLVNHAQAGGLPTNSRGERIRHPEPGGPYWGNVFTGYDDAKVIARTITPEVTLAKWVCSNGTNCPSAWNEIADADQAILVDPANDPAPADAAGWVNRAQVPYNSTVKWLVVVTNTGETALDDVKLTQEVLSPALPGNCQASGLTPTHLDVNESVVYSCTTTAMTYVDGDLVNTAKASGQPVDDDGNKVTGPDGEDWPPVESEEDDASVFTEPPVTGIALTKWVCSTGTGCRDWDHISLVSQRLLKSPETVWAVGDAPIAGWVKATQVEYGTNADWMIVITNTGELPLKDITFLVESVTGTSSATTGCAQGPTGITLLAPGASAGVACTTANITNQEPFGQPLGSGDDVVNTAQAKGTPVLNDGVTRVPRPYGHTTDPADPVSDPDSAEVRTEVPAPSIDIRKYDTLDGDDSETGHYPDTSNPKQLEPLVPTPITLTITNVGTEDLVNVVVSDTLTAGYGQVTGLTCNFQGRAHGLRWVGPFAPNTSFDCTGMVPGLSDGQNHTNLARVDATGRLSHEDVWDDDPWNGEATVVPNISITKFDTLNGDDMVTGHHPVTAKDLEAGVPTPISIYIRNNGTDILHTIVVTDRLVEGAGPVTDLTCAFPTGGSHTATTWTGPFVPGAAFTCTGTVPALEAGQTHTNESTVTGYGTWTGQRLTKPDTWKGRVPPPPNTPMVNIDKYDTLNGDDINTGRHPDPANPKTLVAGTPTPISMTITNNGTDNLVDVVVTDQLTAGSGAITGLTCAFPTGGTRTATTWSGPFLVGASFTCTGTVPALNGGQSHSDKATVTARGVTNNEPVTDEDDWNGDVPPDPSISLVKYDTLNGDNATTGHYPDQANPKTLEASTPTPISITIANNGSDELVDIVVTDQLTAGSGAITGLTCAFPTGGTRTATTWSGPFAIGASFTCTGTVPGLNGGQSHSDKATVTAKGATDDRPVTDEDDWNGDVPPGPSISLVKYDTLNGDNATTGHYPDLASPKHLTQGVPTPISITITNDGTDELVDVVVTDQLTAGSGAITGLTCAFPTGGTRTATTWSGPFAVGASFTCTGTVPGLGFAQTHSDKATVTARGATNNEPVTDDDDWNGDVPEEPVVEPGVPDVDILKFDTLNGDDRVTGRYPDTANPKTLAAGVATPISFLITNNGTEDLINVVVTDETVAGTSGKIADLTCDFSTAGGPTSGTTWAGPFAVNASFTCKGTLPGLAAGQLHTNIATVTGTGKVSGQTPTSSDKWNGRVPPKVITPAGGMVVTSSTGWGDSLPLMALLGTTLVGAAVAIVRRRRTG